MTPPRVSLADVIGGFAPDRPITYSFEFFPPRTPEMERQLWDAIRRLEPLRPSFVSVTYGAGGSTRERTHATVRRIQAETGMVAAAHLTCVGAARHEVDAVARAYWDAGVRHIVALRGDPPEGAAGYVPHTDGYARAADLVAGLKRVADFEISVAAFPEVHPEAPSPQADLDNLKRKLDAGASRAITQFFFDSEAFLRYVERARAAGIEAPIVPGILPITNFARTLEFARKCGARVPAWLARRFADLEDTPEIRILIAAATALEQCRYLHGWGFDHFHFYTLNRAELTAAICRILGAPAIERTPAEALEGAA
ncbi:MAG: methylenetetrahydrofolate reductase [NAD(P)H] [Rhodospirillaceae bacterium]|nr:methylenetetrahydrofolate reductase [NAD(P)H] [Rhodospirillaceae bacterium]